MSELNINPGVELRDNEGELHHFRVRLGVASTFVLVMFGLAGRITARCQRGDHLSLLCIEAILDPAPAFPVHDEPWRGRRDEH